MAIYIKGKGNISPQQTWGETSLLETPVLANGNRFTCVEPDYTQYMDVRQLRRMSRILKMGVASGSMALKEAGITIPDGIITGTSYGCLEDTGIFLSKMITNVEHALNPTPFIQSTHNTIGSQIALLLQCQGYNQTYTQRAFSFENALLDALMELQETPAQHFLVGAADEITDTSHAIQKRFGIFKDEHHAGAINGEGVAYFVLSGEKSSKDKVSIHSLATFYHADETALNNGVHQFLADANLKTADIDLLLMGTQGDASDEEVLQNTAGSLFPSSAKGYFKHLSGEYPTATAFAVWLAARMIEAQTVPESVSIGKANRPLQRVLIFNSYFGKYHSLILLEAC
ncbi:beta-ketoacyl synthase chain length factor [Chryseolinea soli]|uniref:Beta-ketoacyl synthase n=1 Tax=Chryseolinea soli TaxID=2321403 RepID=A0A385SUQ0_9BACT|nr:beta-ketoacyl synthase chain length factor [Chryseolinea soli]AYB34939.1 beta-ketoacyl synthase [Chryseolinea soli]